MSDQLAQNLVDLLNSERHKSFIKWFNSLSIQVWPSKWQAISGIAETFHSFRTILVGSYGFSETHQMDYVLFIGKFPSNVFYNRGERDIAVDRAYIDSVTSTIDFPSIVDRQHYIQFVLIPRMEKMKMQVEKATKTENEYLIYLSERQLQKRQQT